ncbi:MAG: hypothetical protein R3B90_00410 [Planctomycetaceae bacterium]
MPSAASRAMAKNHSQVRLRLPRAMTMRRVQREAVPLTSGVTSSTANSSADGCSALAK